jgi:hypothetical protein
MTPVDPPDHAPVHEIAETLGVVDGPRAERSDSQYRCTTCSKMQLKGSWMIWVPDGVQEGDCEESIIEAARENAYNGMFSGWCLKCAPKKARSSKHWYEFWR